MALEYERKFHTDTDTLKKIDAALTEAPYILHMETTYYDTPDRSLFQRKITLRRRWENGVSVCTMKLPANGYGREEIQLEADSITDAIPGLCKESGFCNLLSLFSHGVLPVCGAKFTRKARKIQFNGSVLEVSLDAGHLLGGSRALPFCEVEVELLSGETRDADLYAVLLQKRFGLVEETLSKYRRALNLAKGEL